jgi:nucleotide-binding universal stress UspA family protein
MVPMIKKILFTTDLSENARYAFAYAAVLAARHGAGIVLLHVMEKSRPSAEQYLTNLFGQEKWKKMQEGLKLSARDVIIGKRSEYDVIRQALASFSAFTDHTEAEIAFGDQDIIVKDGNVIDEILSVAAERECDPIVLGSHKGLMGKTVIGGVTKDILQRSKIPVLVVPPAGDPK